MSAEVHGEGACEVSLDDAEAELERLLADSRFRVSDRQRDILRYLAERRFGGCTEGIKAYSIAIDVLGRSSNFDASIDPIVRIEISRLRAALDGYYAAFGAELGVSVHIPKGSYVALFLQSDVSGSGQVSPSPLAHRPDPTLADGALEGPAMVAASLPPTLRRWMPAALCVALLVLAGVAAWKSIDRPIVTLKPAVTILMSAASPDMAGEASVARDTLLTALSAFNTIVVTRPGSPTQPERRGYEVDLKYYADSDDRSVWWQVVDSASGTLLKSGLERVETEGKEPATIRLEIAGAVARQIASSRGVINALEARSAPPDALGNACVAKAEFMLDGSESGGGQGLPGCLERTLAGDPDDADTTAMLARLYARDTATVPQALDMAKAAVSIAPLSDRAQGALMVARFANGRLDAAIDAGNRAMALNPNNSANAASLSLVLFAAGYFKAANDLAREAVAMEETPPRDASLVIALDAYRNGRWSEASLSAEQAVGNDMLTLAIRVAALGELGADGARQRLGEAAPDRVAFVAAFRQAAKMAQLRPELVASLETGLGKADASFEAVASIAGQ